MATYLFDQNYYDSMDDNTDGGVYNIPWTKVS